MKKHQKIYVLFLLCLLCAGLFSGCAHDEMGAEVTVHEHSYLEAEAVGASCTDAGFVRYVCLCGDEYTEQAEPTGHKPGRWETAREAEQDQEGLMEQYCEICGDLVAAEPIPALPQETEAAWETKEAAESTEAPASAPGGIQGPAHQHKYSKTVLKEAACTGAGSVWHGCECGAGYEEVIPCKGHDLKTSIIPGSCTTDTVKEQVCRDCGRVVSSAVSEKAPGHRFGIFGQGWEVVEKAGCEKDGLEVRACKVCGETVETRTLEALGHDYRDGKSQAPGCEEEGYTSRTCTRCGNTVIGRIPAAGHAWTVREVVKPTCEARGYTLCICAHDNAHIQKTDEVPALGHRETSWKTVQDATCTAEGREEEICGICGKTLNARAIPQKNHSYQLSQHTAPTCTEAGFDTYTCQGCGDSDTETLAAAGHDYQVSQKQEPTCVESGFVRSACTRCGDIREETMAVTGHAYALAEHRDATCLEDGFDRYACPACGGSYQEPISKTGHQYLNTQHKDATCLENGFDIFTCCRCGGSYEEMIPAASHQHVLSAHQDPTCTEAGFDTYTCGRCGDCYTESLAAAGHSYALAGDNGHVKTYTCTRCGDSYSQVYGEEHHFAEAEKVPPTCTAQGSVTYICDDCGESYTETLPALNHTAKTEVIREASCREEGVKVTVCTVCGQELSRETSEKLAHVMKTEITREPDCCNEGQQTTACVLCNGEQTSVSIPKLPHVEKTVVDIQATCTQEGRTTVSCGICQASIREEVIPRLSHNAVTEITRPTCAEAGTETVLCDLCGEVTSRRELPALGHAYEKIHTRPATCSRDGEDTYRCTRCGDSYGETIPQLTHSYAITETVNPTCAEEGRIVRTCGHCGDQQVERLPKPDHVYQLTVLSGTCVREEQTVYTCESCGCTYEEITGGLGDHLYERKSYKAAACTEDGEIVDICAYCGDKRVEILPALRHDYQHVDTVKPTCTEGGCMRYVCRHCGDEFRNELAPTGHYAGSWEVVKAPTQTETGLRRRCCISCGVRMEEEVIDMLPGIDQEFVIDLGGGETTTVVGHLDVDMANEIFDLLNAYREENGRQSLKRNDSLEKGVSIRAPELAVSFAHTRPNGLSCFSVSAAAYGENIASKFTSPESVMQGWKNSPGHNENMLKESYRSAAIGVFAQRLDFSDGRCYYIYHFVQLFGR